MASLKALLLYGCLAAAPVQSALGPSLDSFVKAERVKAVQGILDNMGPDGRFDQGAAAGLVVASPSNVNPDYVFTWTRDSALTLTTVIHEYINTRSRKLEKVIEDYIHAQAKLQTVNNPSGGLYSGAGLGEPKFKIDGTSFKGAWGRPQRDGPALRAIALLEYSKHLLRSGRQQRKVKDVIWPVIANDLAYVGQYWNQTGFDLWEEVAGSSFFTVQAQHRALVQGAQMASRIGIECAGCTVAPQILCFLQTFWDGKTIVANTNTATKRTGADANSLLGSISNFDIEGTCDSPTFQPCSPKILASHKVLVDSFRDIYGINKGKGAGKAVAIGRYAEDVYYTGNPWYLTTMSAAEVLYDAVAQWKARKQLKVDDISLAFFKDLYPSVKKQTYRPGSYNDEFSKILKAVTTYADGFASVVQTYTPTNGSLSEQFGKNDGLPLSAYDLTWSYAAFVTMASRRAGSYPPSWNSFKAAAPPKTCVGTTVKGTYAPAVAAGAPNGTSTCTVQGLFRVNATTYFGENIYFTGNITDLGNWNPDDAFPMNPLNYTSERPLWFLQIDLPVGQTISYNYVRKEDNGSYLYENTNRTATIPACGSEGIVKEDAWSGPVGTPSGS